MTGRMPSRGGITAQEDGVAAFLLLVPVVVVAVVVAVVTVAAGTWALAVGRAQDAVDAAAVAGVHASLAGRPAPCVAARDAVARVGHGARVVACAVDRTATVAVEVAVPLRSPLLRSLVDETVRAHAAAAPHW